ncbi:glycoside hydrolase family 3 protein [Novosphingobium sp. FSY-8]|uniref:beta-glucosidase n=2 Tax=Novosphingobium ovatum TaxID=1908523 RepID=A0ABW9X8Y1_9SPHN|nr:glycoside hydrolase family 3 protein [Novosphingobium ovatum]
MPYKPTSLRRIAAVSTLAVSLCAVLTTPSFGQAPAAAAPPQPALVARVKPVIGQGALRFRDLNGDGQLTPYEDWRLSPAARADDLIARMTIEEKLGLMLHGTLPGTGGALGMSASGYDLTAVAALLQDKHINSFITRLSLTPAKMAAQSNLVQELAENTRLGIPATISTDPRNHFHYVLGASGMADGASQWPELLGFGALGDADLVHRFGQIAAAEYRAVGIHEALSPQVDLASEPLWSRITGTFGSDPQLSSVLGGAYVAGFQGADKGLTPAGVMTVVKHWVGYGALPQGFDSHNYYGRTARLNNAQLELHITAFKGALAARSGGIMPTYPILVGPTVNGKALEPVGAGYSRLLLTDVLRGRMGYDGVILSDWAITRDCNERCSNPTAAAPQRPMDIATNWGVQELSVEDRYALGINAGIDQFGGTEEVDALIAAVKHGKITPARVDDSVRRVLITKFAMGLFENPYVDPQAAETVLRDASAHALAAQTQRAAQVLLHNTGLLPVAPAGKKVWLFGMERAAAQAAGLTVVDTPEAADFAIIRAESPSEMLHPHHFFGSRQKEGRLDFRDGDAAYDALKRASAAHKPAVFALFLDRPTILTNIRPKAAAILANFGASDAAVLDVVLGKAKAKGRLPFELPSSMAAVAKQDPAQPDDSARPLYKRGAGIVQK